MQSIRKYTYEGPIENIHYFLDEVISSSTAQKIILNVNTNTQLYKKINIGCDGSEGKCITTIVMNVIGSLEITGDIHSNTDIILNVSETLKINATIVCGGKFFAKCKNFKIENGNNSSRIYAYKDLSIFADSGIILSSPKTGIETELDYSYRRIIKGDSFISSEENITLSSKDSHIYIGGSYVIARKNIQVGVHSDACSITIECGTIRSTEGSIFHKSSGTLFLKRTDGKLKKVIQGYPYLGAAANYMNQRTRTLFTVEIAQEYPSSGPTIIEALQDIILEGGECINNSSSIVCGGSFVTKNNYKENVLSLGDISKQPRVAEHIFRDELNRYRGEWYQNPFHSEYVAYTYPRYPYGDISFVDYYIPNTRTCVCTVHTGTSISLNMGEFQINGNFSSREIFLSGTSSSFSQFSKSSYGDVNSTFVSNVVVDDYIQSHGLSPMEKIVDGEVRFIVETPISNECNIPTIGELSQTKYKDPIQHIPISHHIQSILSNITGKTFVEKIQYPDIVNPYGYASGSSLLRALVDNTKAVIKYINHHKPEKLELHAPILYKKEKDGILHTVLEIPGTSSTSSATAGVNCHAFTNTTASQTYTNYPIHAKDDIIITSEKIVRKTTQYTEEKWWLEDDGNKKCHVSYDIPYSQQTFETDCGNISIQSKEYKCTGAYSSANEVVEDCENIQKNSLVLSTSYSSIKYSQSGFSGTKCTQQSICGNSFLKPETRAKTLSKTTSKITKIEGFIEKSGEEIQYECDDLTIMPSQGSIVNIAKETVSSHFSSSSAECKSVKHFFEKGEMQAKRIVFSSKNRATVCSDITAEELIDKTENGIIFDRVIESAHTFQSSSQKSYLSFSKHTKESLEKYAKGSIFRIQKIVRNANHGRIEFMDTLFEVEPIIIGRFNISTYIPQNYIRECSEHSQVIPNELIVVICFAVSYFTLGLGIGSGSLCSIIANAAITTTISSFTGNILTHGDFSMALSSIASTKHIKHIAVNAGVNMLFGNSLPPSNEQSLISRMMNGFSYHFLKGCTRAILSKALLQEKIEFSKIIRSSIAYTSSAEIAHIIGDSQLEPFQHALSHFLCGGIMGWLLDSTRGGWFSGGMGAFITEMLLHFENQNSSFTKEELRTIAYQKIIISNIVIALFKGSTNVSLEASINSVEHNSLQHSSLFTDRLGMQEEIEKMISDEKYANKRIERILSNNEKISESFYAEEFQEDPLEREWQYTPSLLLSVQNIINKTFYKLSSLPDIPWRELEVLDYVGLPSAYAVRGISKIDSILHNPLQKISNDIHRLGNVIRKATFSLTQNKELSQNMGICSEWILGSFLPFSKTKSIGNSQMLGKKKFHIKNESASGMAEWGIKDITASSVINFDKKTDKMFSILNKRIVREKDAPAIIIGHGSYRSITIDTQKMIVQPPKFNFANGVPLSISKKRITPLREFPVKQTPAKDIKYISAEVDMDARMFSRYMKSIFRSTSTYPKEVSLYSCYVGSGTFAQNVSNKLGIPVHAPTSALLIHYLGKFKIVDTRMVNGTIKQISTPSKGILKTFFPRKDSTVLCFAPLVLLPEIKDILDTNMNGIDEKLFVESSKHTDGEWKKGCYSGDINFISRMDANIQRDISFAKEELFQKDKKCPVIIIAHGEVNSIQIDDIKPIENVLTCEQQRRFGEDGYLRMDAKEFAETLLKTDDYITKKSNSSNKHIHLFSCNTGCLPDGFAAQLSKELNTTVTAFSGYAWIDTGKKVFAAGVGDYDAIGRFVTYDKGSIKTFLNPTTPNY